MEDWCFSRSGGMVTISSTLGDVTLGSDDKVSGAAALRVVLAVVTDTRLWLPRRGSPSERVQVDAADAAKAWESKFIDILEEASRDPPENTLVSYAAARSAQDGFDETQGTDFGLIALAFGLIVTFVTLANAARKTIESRVLISLAGVLATVIAVPAGIGVASLTGTPYSSIVGLAPFLLIGVGVDDMFVFSSAVQRTPREWPIPKRVGRCAREAGMGVTLTSATDILAFAIGASSPFRAVAIFCVYTLSCIALVYFLMCTFLLACIVLDIRREAAGRSPFTCRRVAPLAAGRGSTDGKALDGTTAQAGNYGVQDWGGIGPSPDDEAPATESFEKWRRRTTVASSGRVTQQKSQRSLARRASQPKREILRSLPERDDLLLHGFAGARWDRAFARKVGPCILAPISVVAVLVLYAAAIAAGLYGTTEVDEGLDLGKLTPSDHYSSRYEATQARFFTRQATYDLVVDGSLDYGRGVVREAVNAMPQEVINRTREFADSRDTTWLDSIGDFLVARGDSRRIDLDEAGFNTLLADWLEHGANEVQFGGNLALVDKGTGQALARNDASEAISIIRGGGRVDIRACVLSIKMRPIQNSQREADSMTAIREAASRSRDSVSREYGVSLPRIFPFYEGFVLFEQYRVIVPSTIQSMLAAAVSVMAVSVVLLPSVTVIATLLLGLGGINILLFGGMWLLSIPLDAISAFSLVLAIGFSVDFTAHVAHGFLFATGNGFQTGYACCLPSIPRRYLLDGVVLRPSPPPMGLSRTESTRVAEVGPVSEDGVEGLFGGPTRQARMVEALTLLGRPVFQGGASTLLGLIPLAFTNSHIFSIFFKMLYMIIAFGLLHGIVILPIYLRIWGPRRMLTLEDIDEEDDDDVGNQETELGPVTVNPVRKLNAVRGRPS